MLKKSVNTMIITMISRILGLLRGTLVAYFFGSSGLTDAYYSAFKISNFFRQLLGEGALGNTFIPLYHKKRNEQGEKKSSEYIFTVLNMTFLFSLLISILMIVFSERIVSLIVVGFNEEMRLLTSKLLKLMSFYFLFISLSGMIGSILNNFGYFVIPASTAIFFNLSIIFSAMYLIKYFSIDALAYGVLFGGFLQFIVVFIPFLCIMKKYIFKINFKDIYLKMLGLKLLPMLVGVFARQINSVVDQFFASFLLSGTITALENASRIYLLPVGVFGVSISNVVFPGLSKAAAKKNKQEIRELLAKSLNFLNFLIIPSLVILTFYSKDIIKLIFSYGKFDEEAVRITSEALLFYSLGLIFYVGVQLISKAYYAVGDNRRPARYSIFAILLNIILNFFLIESFKHQGLALATSISSGINFMLLLSIYNKIYVKLDIKNMLYMFFRILIKSGTALYISSFFSNIFIKLIIFSIIYLIQWSYSAFKFKDKMFYKK